MKEQIKDWMNYGIVSSLGVALSDQQQKKTGKGVITAYASYYVAMAEQAINGRTKKEREAAVMFLIEQLHNNAAMLYNNGIDIEDFRKKVDELAEKWEK